MKIKIIFLSLTFFLSIFGMNNQNEIVPYVGLVPKKIHEAKTQLNDDFYQNAKINDIVSYIYYPTGAINLGHTELEVQGECWGISIQHESLEEKIKRSTTIDYSKIDHFRPHKMLGRYFKQYQLTVSPHELKQLKESIKKSFEIYQSSTSESLLSVIQDSTYKTCSYYALSRLSENCNFNIPMPYKTSPLLTDLYIKITKPSKIKQIKEYGQRRGYEGELGECIFMIILPMLFLYIAYTS